YHTGVELNKVQHTDGQLSLFFITKRQPPRPTLFPYTTLFRSKRPLEARGRLGAQAKGPRRLADARPVEVGRLQKDVGRVRRDRRSEEHTSELQSLAYLVCRLLLEKKKTYECHYGV